MKEEKKEIPFEKAIERLEEILEKMNSGAAGLDESLKLFEEADHLIAGCHKRLNEAERKVEMLVKNRQGDLAVGSDQKPMTQPFEAGNPPKGTPHHA